MPGGDSEARRLRATVNGMRQPPWPDSPGGDNDGGDSLLSPYGIASETASAGREAHGAFESGHPGCRGADDTVHVGMTRASGGSAVNVRRKDAHTRLVDQNDEWAVQRAR